ncbi:MAG: SRPBCC family protein [Gemmatirosa sp.]
MFAVETTLVVPYPAPAIFTVASALTQAPRWRAGVVGVAEAQGAPPGGAVVAFRALRARYALATRVVAYDPPRRVAWRSRGPAFVLEVALTLEDAPEGTRMIYHCGLALTSDDALPPGHATALRRLLVRRAPRDLERLATLMAGEAAPPMTATTAATIGAPA